MGEWLFNYQPVPATTWVYLSSLIMIALFFKFSRLWSVRNLDLLGLIMLAPGMLFVEYGRSADPGSWYTEAGFIWMFVVGALFMIRLFVDPSMVRRPLLEPNMTAGGLTFIGVALLVFLTANVLTSDAEKLDLTGPEAAEQLQARRAVPRHESTLPTRGPGYPLLHWLPSISTQTLFPQPADDAPEAVSGHTAPRTDLNLVMTARLMAILAHLAVVAGIVLIGLKHFDNIKTGIAAAVLYLVMPYTAQNTGRVDHALMAALLVWAVVAYRRPLLSGMILGLAIGTLYYPIFLLPLWCAFYWEKGLLRFIGGVTFALLVLVGTLAFTAGDFDAFVLHVRQMLGFILPWNAEIQFHGFWAMDSIDSVYRLPVLVAFIVMMAALAAWPARKNLGTLMSCSAAVMLGAQFWHAHDGGLYVAWYLPLLLLTVFRPNLEDRVALTVLGEPWIPKRFAHVVKVRDAA
jgi:hypothetical protein